MLPAAHRMRRPSEFATVIRRGRRAGSRRLVAHHGTLPGDAPSAACARTGVSRVGLVVSKAVGPSVVRHRVARRLRAQLVPHLDRLPAGSGTVIRALPAAATASSAELGADLHRVLARFEGGA